MTSTDGVSTTAQLEAAVNRYGGRPYGLEPLFLPVEAGPLGQRAADGELCGRYPELLGYEAATDPPQELDRPGSPDELFWFRWITGHQLTFVLWQELGRLAAAAPAAQDPVDDARAATRLIRGYSGLLLYAASCTRDVYQRVIRPSMALHHPRFTGAWARDYAPVRPLLRGRTPAAWSGEEAALTHETELNNAVHEGIGGKLVPGAPSLLQTASNGQMLPRDVCAVLFDTYFLTLRAPAEPGEVAAQLLRRVRAVQNDLRTNGLYPDFASSRHEKPPSLTTPEVVAIEGEIPPILNRIARDAVRCGETVHVNALPGGESASHVT
ncbi:L-tyrosine 3-hydroxylase [Kitasatospora cathayae]|uniref:L-tyrosine 3-hydroxylase n=1 Tax=Kitasatospora cathayae TaxID=3004092 RepID=A0ABY7QEF1_9ACTN|nr:L-tyrosine 3-hydroxylase [Kitasatospora sp. HUAS 3-15]WBP90912.1 L-tyrosine 3-hydroxylase [Kitasatospora sp. HUAS 3-15]